MMPGRDQDRRQFPQILLLAVVTLLAAVSGMASLARQAAEFGPGVGDIVTFRPGGPSLFDSAARLTADREGQASCVLDLGLMQKSGGSLVVEQRGAATDRFYRAHWAGPRTSEDATNCGTEADLVLSRTDMAALALAASGPGADKTGELRVR
jgi:hypothetical protein